MLAPTAITPKPPLPLPSFLRRRESMYPPTAAVDSRLRGNDEEKKLGLRRKEAGMATWGRGSGALWRFFI